MNPEETVLVEGPVSIRAAGDTGMIGAVSAWNPRVDKVTNLADFIEAAFGSEHNTGFYRPMRITIERMPS